MPAVKIAIVGSAPSSVAMAPFGDPSWNIMGCSPGAFPYARRCDAWLELHRWEPGVIGAPETQKPWFTPEYVACMARQPLVWMERVVPEIPGSRELPVDRLVQRFGSAWFTSSVAYMLAMAIEDILEARAKRAEDAAVAAAAGHVEPVNTAAQEPDTIVLWCVDMAATEEYGYQRAGCQHFCLLAHSLGIKVSVPPESDLMRPMPLYGIMESSHWHIKNTARLRELQGRLEYARQAIAGAQREEQFLLGAIDDIGYQMQTWAEDRELTGTCPEILALIKSGNGGS